MNSASHLNTSETIVKAVLLSTVTTLAPSLAISTTNEFPAMEVPHSALNISTIPAPDLLGVTQDPDILAMCHNSLMPLVIEFHGGIEGSGTMTPSEGIAAVEIGTTKAPEISCVSDDIVNDWEKLTSDLASQVEAVVPELIHVVEGAKESQSTFVVSAENVSGIEEEEGRAGIADDCLVGGDLDLFVEDFGVNDINSDLMPQLSKIDDVESAQEDDVPAPSLVKSPVGKKGKSSKEAKLLVATSALNTSSRPKRAPPRRSVFELLQGEMRGSSSVTTKRRNSGSSDVEQEDRASKSVSKSMQLFSGYGSSEEDKPSKKQKKHASSSGVTRSRAPRRPVFDYDVEPIYSADDFGEFNMNIDVEPAAVASKLIKPSGVELLNFGSANDTGKESESLWTTPKESKKSSSVTQEKSPALEELQTDPGVTFEGGARVENGTRVETETMISGGPSVGEPRVEDGIIVEGRTRDEDGTIVEGGTGNKGGTTVEGAMMVDSSIAVEGKTGVVDQLSSNSERLNALEDKHLNNSVAYKSPINKYSSVPWLTAAVEKEALAHEAAGTTLNLDVVATVDTELKGIQRPSPVLLPLKKFNIDPHTRKFIRIRDTTGSNASAGRQTGGLSVTGGDTEDEKKLKHLAVTLKIKEAKLCALDRELDARTVAIKLFEGRVVRRERALKDTEKSMEGRETKLRSAEAAARAQRDAVSFVEPAVTCQDQETSNIFNVASHFDACVSLLTSCPTSCVDVARVAQKQDELDRLRQRMIDERVLILSNEQRLAKWEAELQERQNEFDKRKRNVKKNTYGGGGEGGLRKGSSGHEPEQNKVHDVKHPKASMSVHKHVSKVKSHSVTNGIPSKIKKASGTTTVPDTKRRVVPGTTSRTDNSTDSEVRKTH